MRDQSGGAEAPSHELAKIEGRNRLDRWRSGIIELRYHALHGVANARVDEPRELVDRVVRTATGRVGVQWVGDRQVVAGSRHRDVHEPPLLLELVVVA